MAPTALTCSCCNRAYEAISMVRCCVCKKHFKNTCVDISSNEIRMLNSNKGCEWSCKSCRSVGNDIKDLKAIIMKLQEDISNLKVDLGATAAPQISDDRFEDIIREINDRNKRRNNLIVFGVPEQNQELPNNERVSKEKSEVTDILKAIVPEFNITIKPERLGKYSPGKNRPIKISFHSEKQVCDFVYNGKKIKNGRFKHVSLSFDRTVRQISHYKKVKEELQQRISDGERGLKIKHFDGVPRIVSIQSN